MADRRSSRRSTRSTRDARDAPAPPGPTRDGARQAPQEPPKAPKARKPAAKRPPRAGARGAAKRPAGGRTAPAKSRVARPGPALGAADVRWVCRGIRPSKRPPKATALLGQERPMAALRIGLELYAAGYNIFVSGLIGSGRTRIVQNLLEEMMPVCRLGPDRVFVHNFDEPNQPKLLTLRRGKGAQFRDEIVELVDALREALKDALHSRRHKASRKLVVNAAEQRHKRLFAALGREARRQGCALIETQRDDEVAADILPLQDGKPMSIDDFEALVRDGKVTRKERNAVARVREELLERLEEISERIRRNVRMMEHELRVMDRRLGGKAITPLLEAFGRRWAEPKVQDHLAAIGEQVEADLGRWLADDEPLREHKTSDRAADAVHARGSRSLGLRFQDLRVLVLKGDTGAECPVVVESNPTYNNLFGTIEAPREAPTWELGRIHPGSLVRADGGYVILRAADVIAEPGVWQQLKRALKAGKVEVREFDPGAGTTAGTLQPEAIPIDIKVVMIGEPGYYEHLAHEDPQFLQLFKVHAEFDRTVPNNPQNRRRYADFLAWIARSENLGRFSPDAAAAIAEHGARRAGRRDRLTTCFGELADIAREAGHLSGRAGNGPIDRQHVEQALRGRDARLDLAREQVEREFAEGYLLLRTTGRAVGLVNGLTVVDTGTFSFGKPVRITATTGPAPDGKSDVLNIEREAELSGPLHDKGVLILQGFLLDLFGGGRPVGLQATICFEQLYSGLDGDSASCAELLALLSSLADVPLDQGLAVTGSMDQLGEVQAVGGVNEKIEAFYRACKARRLTGRQGVVIPRANADDLMLQPDVVAAVAQGRFSVFTIGDVLEGLELLAGRPVAEVLQRARATIERFWELRQQDRDG